MKELIKEIKKAKVIKKNVKTEGKRYESRKRRKERKNRSKLIIVAA